MLIYVENGDTNFYITFASKAPHKTRSLVINFVDGDMPTELIDDLREVGWAKENAGMLPLVELPPLDNRREIDLFAKGTGMFGDWTEEESKTHLRNARRVLKKHGVIGVPHYKLTYADLV